MLSALSLKPFTFLDGFEIFLNALIQSGLMLRPPLKQHPKTRQVYWLQGWEYDADEADRVMNSRPNWVPDPTTGISVPMLSPFSAQGANLIETQTGLSLAQCELFFAIACALQLVAQPNKQNQAAANMHAIEEWFGLSPEDKLGRAWSAWTEQMMAGVEARNAMGSLKASEAFWVMRAIGARVSRRANGRRVVQRAPLHGAGVALGCRLGLGGLGDAARAAL
ncbi:MAG: hypothetical protein HC853_07890 [Anaerolineae bacterium]|nr:hypothetical protein [Anaerolineae bacterium]